MEWPLKWFIPVEVALNVYHTLTAVNTAMSKLKDDALTKWQSENSRLIDAALHIQAIRDGVEND
jgi:hypothetical protein